MSVYLIDTCIWRDFYEDRYGRICEPLGKRAAELFEKILRNRDLLLISELTMREMQANELFEQLFRMGAARKIEGTQRQKEEAVTLARAKGINIAESLLQIQAKEFGANFVRTI